MPIRLARIYRQIAFNQQRRYENLDGGVGAGVVAKAMLKLARVGKVGSLGWANVRANPRTQPPPERDGCGTEAINVGL
jgi:hypothetical protein